LADAGHILGSAMTALAATTGGRTVRLTYTGDLGRFSSFLLRDPSPVPPADWVVSESTYGGRHLDAVRCACEALEEVIRRTIERGGKVLVPAFSLGRTQVVLFALQQAIVSSRIPRVPVYVDSPLAAEITKVYRRHAECLKAEAVAGLDGDLVQYLGSTDESQAVSQAREPSIIIAPSGMCEGGRIVHHLKYHIDDPRYTIVLVNYQAPHTPGHRLLERGPTIRIHGKKCNKWADVVYLAGFSGHADHEDLLTLLGALPEQTRFRLVHGEEEQARALSRALQTQGYDDIAIPGRGETVTLD
jgi:metallo-beta-lactamase family protein